MPCSSCSHCFTTNDITERHEVRRWARTELDESIAPPFGSEERMHAKATVEEAESEISALKSQVEELCSYIEHIQVSLVKARAVYAPIRMLPPELIGRIMSFTLNPSLHLPDEKLQVARLSSVSRQWSSIAKSTALLWSSFKITRENINKVNTSLLQKWIAYSKREPLYVTYDDPSPGDPNFDIFHALLGHADRWVTGNIDLGLEGTGKYSSLPYEPTILLDQLNKAQNLRTLSLAYGPAHRGDNFTAETSTEPLHLKQLRELRLMGRYMEVLCHLDAPSLVRLSIGTSSFSRHTLHLISSRLPSLRSLTLTSPESYTADIGYSLPHLHNLSELHVEDSRRSVSNGKLESDIILGAPNITHWTTTLHSEKVGVLKRLPLDRISCLKVVVDHNTGQSHDMLSCRNWMKAMPNLGELVVEFVGVGSHWKPDTNLSVIVIKGLTAVDVNWTPPCPNLTHLQFVGMPKEYDARGHEMSFSSALLTFSWQRSTIANGGVLDNVSSAATSKENGSIESLISSKDHDGVAPLPCFVSVKWSNGDGRMSGTKREDVVKACYAELEGREEWR